MSFENLPPTEPMVEKSSVLHTKARSEKPLSYPERFPVADNQVTWSSEYPEYAPSYFVAEIVINNDESKNPNGWAESEELPIMSQKDYQSYEGHIMIDNKGKPLNPNGRTGIEGRGLLGKWGANFAADPIITRKNPESKALELLVIKRTDNGEFALPGGMVDLGEKMSATASRELHEEAGINVDMTKAKKIYEGYVDDPRNTDNAWMETSAYHFHLNPEDVSKIVLKAGDDASDAIWMELTPDNLNGLYASHSELVKLAMDSYQ